MRRVRKAIGLGVAIATIGVALRPTAMGLWVDEGLALPWLFALRGAVDPPAGVVVVSIDKTSSDQIDLGESWPPSRHVHASVLRALSRHGASAIIMDVFFKVRRSSAEDEDLARAIAESGRVALFENVERLRYSGGDIVQTRSPIQQFRHAALATAAFPLPEGGVTFFWTFVDATSGKVPTLPAVALQILALPYLPRLLPVLLEAGIANVTDLPRTVRTAAEFRDLTRVLRRELGGRPDARRRALARLEREQDGGWTAEERRVLAALVRLYGGDDSHTLNFYGPPGTIRTIPFHELLTDGERSRTDLRGAVVFVGEGASELVVNPDQRDTHRTVYSRDGVNLSGAEIAATAFANLLTNRTLQRVPIVAELAILVLFGLVAAYLARVLPGLYAVAGVLVLACAYYGGAQYLFTDHALLVPAGVPLLVQAPIALFAGVLFRYRDVRRQVAREVDAGAPPDLVQGVCLSTDIENYVTASAGMEPGELAALMSEYYETLAGLVRRRHGLMMGRAGDSAMCVWTATGDGGLLTRLGGRRRPAGAMDRQAQANACRAALDIRETIERFNARHPTPLRTRIGLHLGTIAMGAVGGEYHVIGDVPNTASRIEGLNKQLGTSILASEDVVRDQDGVCARPVGRFALPGRPGELAIVEIIGLRETVGPQTQALCRRFASALAVFETGDLDQAGRLFEAIARDCPADGPSRYYQRLCSGDAAVIESINGRPTIRIDTK